MTDRPEERYKLTEKGRELVDTMTWGGARPGAGRPRTESLDAAELEFLAWLVNDSAYSAEYADLVNKMLRMADRVKRTGR